MVFFTVFRDLPLIKYTKRRIKNMDKKGKCENLGENSSENVKISDFEV